jgi:hypothetical protein
MEEETPVPLRELLWDGARLFGVINEDRLRFLYFAAVNLVAGSVGLFVPLLMAVTYSNQTLWSVLLKLLDDGNGFTFSAALLATSSAFLLTGKPSDVEESDVQRQVRKLAALCSIILFSLVLLYCGAHFVNIFRFTDNPAAKREISFAQTAIQSALTLGTVAYAIWLFCVEHCDRHEKYASLFKGDRDKRATAAGGPERTSGDYKA